MDKLSDEMLVAHFQGGRQDAFDVLMSRYKQKIYAYLLRSVKNYEDAEELTIEVFIKIYRKFIMKRHRRLNLDRQTEAGLMTLVAMSISQA